MLVTVQEYSELTGMPERIARRLCESRELPCIRIGNRWLIESDSQARAQARDARKEAGR